MQSITHVSARAARWPLAGRLALALGAGWIAAWAMPPSAVFLALLPAFSALILLLHGARTLGGGFGLAWAYAFAFHLSGLSWVGEAFLVDAATFGWMRPLAVGGLAAGLALLTGIAGAAFVRIRSGRAVPDVLLLAALFMLAEWLRGHLLTGFPWNLPVQAFDRVLPVLQGVAWIGPYGVSLIILAAAGAAAVALLPGTRCGRLLGVAVVLAPLCGIALAGSLRLAAAPDMLPTVPDVRIRIVQPNIPQREKWRPELQGEHFRRHLRLSEREGSDTVTHLVWPEAATAFLLPEAPEALRAISAVTPPGGATIVGTPRHRPPGPDTGGGYANSVAVISAAGTVTAVYDKHHLVPFGEYVPLRRWLPIDRIAPGHGSFDPGPGPRTLTAPGAPPFSPLVCYEAIFPGAVIDPANRPGWLLNVTNDAWFGASAGPHQHLSIARLRAMEEGLPLVRAANTGISVMIDPYGRILALIPLGVEGILDQGLPVALPPPLYTVLKDWLFVALAGGFLAVGAVSRRLRW